MRCITVIGLVFSLTFATDAQAQAQVRLQTGDAAPDSLGTDRDGKQVRIADYHGKVVVLTFWATWCGYCLKELPILENLQRRLGKARIEVVAINTDKNRVDYIKMRRRLKDFQLTMTADEGRGAGARYGVSGLPHLVMVDKAGRVAHVHIGYAEKSLPGFVDEINALMDEPQPTPAQVGS